MSTRGLKRNFARGEEDAENKVWICTVLHEKETYLPLVVTLTARRLWSIQMLLNHPPTIDGLKYCLSLSPPLQWNAPSSLCGSISIAVSWMREWELRRVGVFLMSVQLSGRDSCQRHRTYSQRVFIIIVIIIILLFPFRKHIKIITLNWRRN